MIDVPWFFSEERKHTQKKTPPRPASAICRSCCSLKLTRTGYDRIIFCTSTIFESYWSVPLDWQEMNACEIGCKHEHDDNFHVIILAFSFVWSIIGIEALGKLFPSWHPLDSYNTWNDLKQDAGTAQGVAWHALEEFHGIHTSNIFKHGNTKINSQSQIVCLTFIFPRFG